MSAVEQPDMVELLSKPTKEEWVRFKMVHAKYVGRKKNKTALVLIAVCFLVTIISGFVLFHRIEEYLVNIVASFPFPIRLRHMITFELLTDRILLTGGFFILFLYELFQSYRYHFPRYVRKKVKQQMNEADFSESHICLTDEAIWSYSVKMDLRLNWSLITQVFQTEEMIVLFAAGDQHIVISKKLLTEHKLQLVKSKLDRCFDGSIVEL